MGCGSSRRVPTASPKPYRTSKPQSDVRDEPEVDQDDERPESVNSRDSRDLEIKPRKKPVSEQNKDGSDLCDRCNEFTVTYYIEEDRELVCGRCFGRYPLSEVEDFVQSLQFKQREIKSRSDLEKRRFFYQDAIRKNADYDVRIRSKKDDFMTQIDGFEKDLQTLVRHLAEDMRRKSASSLESKLRTKRQWMEKVEEHLEKIKELDEQFAAIGDEPDQASQRIRKLLASEGLVQQSPIDSDEAVEPEDLELKFDLDLKMDDIFGNGNVSKDIELGGFQIVKGQTVRNRRTVSTSDSSRYGSRRERAVTYSTDAEMQLEKDRMEVESEVDFEAGWNADKPDKDSSSKRSPQMGQFGRLAGLPSNKKYRNINNFYFYDPPPKSNASGR